MPKISHTCLTCGTEFITYSPRSKYCSNVCKGYGANPAIDETTMLALRKEGKSLAGTAAALDVSEWRVRKALDLLRTRELQHALSLITPSAIAENVLLLRDQGASKVEIGHALSIPRSVVTMHLTRGANEERKASNPLEFILTFGKYKNRPAKNVPGKYLFNLIENRDTRLTVPERAMLSRLKSVSDHRKIWEAEQAKEKEWERKQQIERDKVLAKRRSASKVVGVPGERLAMQVRLVEQSPLMTFLGVTQQLTFEDAEHNLLIASLQNPPAFGEEEITLVGTIKEHLFYPGGGRQTFVSRVSFPELEDA